MKFWSRRNQFLKSKCFSASFSDSNVKKMAKPEVRLQSPYNQFSNLPKFQKIVWEDEIMLIAKLTQSSETKPFFCLRKTRVWKVAKNDRWKNDDTFVFSVPRLTKKFIREKPMCKFWWDVHNFRSNWAAFAQKRAFQWMPSTHTYNYKPHNFRIFALRTQQDSTQVVCETEYDAKRRGRTLQQK